MAWQVIQWVIFFILNMALIAANLYYQMVCLADLEADYMNPYDSSSRINAVVITEMLIHGVCCALFLLTGHWFMFLLALPITIYNAMLLGNTSSTALIKPTSPTGLLLLQASRYEASLHLSFPHFPPSLV